MSQIFGVALNLFTLLRDHVVNSLIIIVETLEFSRELLSHIRGFTKNLSSKCLDLLDSPGSTLLLFDRQVITKLILILLLQEIHEEFAASENFGLHDRDEELLVVHLLFVQLLLGEFLFLVD